VEQQELIIVRGVPGSGKSTIAQNLLKQKIQDCAHIEADDYFLNESGVYHYNKHLIQDAHNWCEKQTKQMLQHGWTVIVANPFIKIWEMQPYFDMAKSLKLACRVIEAKGKFRNTHFVPNEVVVKMQNGYEPYKA
jgi:predicted kinase